MRKPNILLISIIILIISLIPAKLMSLSKKINVEDLRNEVFTPDKKHPSNVKIEFFGTSCLAFSYKGSTYLNDPFFSNPSYLEIITGRYKDHSDVINPYLNKMDSISMVTITHGHYDHCLDFPYFMKNYTHDAKIVSGTSALLSLDAYFQENKSWNEYAIEKKFNDNWIYSADKVFRVYPIISEHQAHIGKKIKLFSGENTSPLDEIPGSVWKWKEGNTYSYVLDVMNGKEIVDRFLIIAGELPQESLAVINKLQKEKRINIMFSPFWHKEKSGLAFESSYESLQPEKVIFHHWNNFFNNAEQDLECIRSSDIVNQVANKRLEGYPVSIMLPFSEIIL
jgi:hypothetical protein